MTTQTDQDRALQLQAREANDVLCAITEVQTPKDYLSVAQALVNIKRAQTYVAARKEQITAPVKALQATAKAWFGAPESQLQAAEAQARALLVDYITRRVPEAAAEAQQAVIDGNTGAVMALMVAVPQADGITIRKEVDFVVDNLDLVPEEYTQKTPRVAQIKAALRHGEVIPGITRLDQVALSVTTGG